MFVHTLVFGSTSELMRCFEMVMDHESVEDCLVEPEHLRLRFLAPDALSDRLIERIYQERGLRWCTRHPLEADAPAAGQP